MKTLGIIGGTSWHSTIEYYRHINSAVNEVYGNETNPPLILYNLNQAKIHSLQHEGRWDDIATIYSNIASRLESIGADAIIFAANTAHSVFTKVVPTIRVPILHIGTALGAAIQRAGLTSVGLLGTIFTMQQEFLRAWLHDHYGITVTTPASATARERLQFIIERELGLGKSTPASKQFILNEIAELERRGARAIVLGCTELPLIIKPSDVNTPVFDTTRLHSQMAVDFVLERGAQTFPAAHNI
jgi:aspartate racemase